MNASGSDEIDIKSIYPKSKYARNLKKLIIVRLDKIKINVIKENTIGTTISIKNRLTSKKTDDK
jgi:hypothetical protein